MESDYEQHEDHSPPSSRCSVRSRSTPPHIHPVSPPLPPAPYPRTSPSLCSCTLCAIPPRPGVAPVPYASPAMSVVAPIPSSSAPFLPPRTTLTTPNSSCSWRSQHAPDLPPFIPSPSPPPFEVRDYSVPERRGWAAYDFANHATPLPTATPALVAPAYSYTYAWPPSTSGAPPIQPVVEYAYAPAPLPFEKGMVPPPPPFQRLPTPPPFSPRLRTPTPTILEDAVRVTQAPTTLRQRAWSALESQHLRGVLALPIALLWTLALTLLLLSSPYPMLIPTFLLYLLNIQPGPLAAILSTSALLSVIFVLTLSLAPLALIPFLSSQAPAILSVLPPWHLILLRYVALLATVDSELAFLQPSHWAWAHLFWSTALFMAWTVVHGVLRTRRGSGRRWWVLLGIIELIIVQGLWRKDAEILRMAGAL